MTQPTPNIAQGYKMNAGGKMGVTIAIGIAIGAGVGAATGNMGLWLSLGVALGAAMGSVAMGRAKKDEESGSDDPAA